MMSNPRTPLPPGMLAEGSRFGEYTIGACIGEGGMARVYSAELTGLSRPVALKVLIDGQNSEHAAHERFLREACIAAAIKHPNVVSIFDVGVHRGTPYLVMDLLEGADLESFVRDRGRLDEATLIDIMVPIAAGLAAVHDAGVVHRDLKPSNIFLARGRDGEMEPRLLDFGISKSLDADALKLTAAHGLLLGTPFYMAPEGVNGGEMTPLSDQYSLGVVLYECATGINPFAEASDLADVVRRVGLGELPAVASQNSELSPRLVALIERAMQLDPARRFPDVRALGRELLLLAGQRTRVTWNLNFTVLAARGLCARAATISPDPNAGEMPRSRRSPLRLLPWAAAAVAALSLSGAKSPAETSSAPRSAEVSIVQSALQSAEGTTQARGAEPAHSAVERAPLATAKASSVYGAAAGGGQPKPASLHPPVPARPATPPAQRVHSSGTRLQRRTQYGTNHAPIFE